MTELSWTGCYDDSWAGYHTPAALGHPAKFARGLVTRIYRHLLERGWLQKGSLVGDPFAGVGGGGIVAAYQGLRWVGVELEERFRLLGEESFTLHRQRWQAMGDPEPVLLAGDSRNFAEIVRCSAIVTSPPYAGSSEVLGGGCRIDWDKVKTGGKKPTAARIHAGEKYGSTEGQIGALPTGSLVDAITTSPPFSMSDCQPLAGHQGVRADYEAKGIPRNAEPYGYSPGQIGRLKEGALADAIVTSPPYEKTNVGNGDPEGEMRRLQAKAESGKLGRENARMARLGKMPLATNANLDHYGKTEGQIGDTAKETYWLAMRQVYQSCLAALIPGGVLVVVVKDYIKNKTRVVLCNQTLSLLTHLGFEPVERIRAWLVEERREPGLFGEVVKRKEKVSFFRRIHRKKFPHLAIDNEEVLIVRRPKEDANGHP